jgi:nicotinamide-nucleotide amidase
VGGRPLAAEIIGVGTELLLGQIANTNSQHISAALADLGVHVYWHCDVGDNLERVVEAFRIASGRADVIVVTGGLGPTPDDLTRAAVARWLGRPLVRDERLAALISKIFADMGRDMPEHNLRQADLPEGATPIDPVGTAPGFIVENTAKGRAGPDRRSTGLCALPGVPWEMRAMLDSSVLPWLRTKAGESTIVSRQVLVIGLGESTTHARIADIVEAQTNPTIAYLAGGGQVRVRITAKAGDSAEAESLIAPVEASVRERLGDAAVPGSYGSVSRALAEVLLEQGATVAAAESLTAGLIGAELTAQEGSSEFFLGSLVVYATDAKSKVAGVPDDLIAAHGVVSAETAGALAEAAAQRFGADLGVATTGVAGPASQEGCPPGTVHVGAHWHGRTETRSLRSRGDRSFIRALAVTAALDLGRRVITAEH